MVIRLSNKIGLKTLFMKEGEAAEGIIRVSEEGNIPS